MNRITGNQVQGLSARFTQPARPRPIQDRQIRTQKSFSSDRSMSSMGPSEFRKKLEVFVEFGEYLSANKELLHELRNKIPPATAAQMKDAVYRPVASQDQEMYRLFQEADINNDGKLDLNELKNFLAAWQETDAGPPRPDQLVKIAMQSALACAGFGFMDNFVMIIAGDALESWLGAVWGISGLLAAGVGNIASDLIGMTSSGSIEQAVGSFNWLKHGLSDEQRAQQQVQMVVCLGAAVGIVAGCLLGLGAAAAVARAQPGQRIAMFCQSQILKC